MADDCIASMERFTRGGGGGGGGGGGELHNVLYSHSHTITFHTHSCDIRTANNGKKFPNNSHLDRT